MEAATRDDLKKGLKPDPLKTLPPRQLEALKLAAKGFTAVESAVYMGCAVKTVETHLAKVRERWEVSSTIEAAVLAVKRGIL